VNDFGKRYVCKVCGTEALCTKAGSGVVACDGAPMELKVPEQRTSDQVD